MRYVMWIVSFASLEQMALVLVKMIPTLRIFEEQ